MPGEPLLIGIATLAVVVAGFAGVTLGPTATLFFWANALVVGSVALYALALCIQLSVAAVSFYSLVATAQG